MPASLKWLVHELVMSVPVLQRSAGLGLLNQSVNQRQAETEPAGHAPFPSCIMTSLLPPTFPWEMLCAPLSRSPLFGLSESLCIGISLSVASWVQTVIGFRIPPN